VIARLRRRVWRIAGAVSVRSKIMGIVIGVILVLGGAITYQFATRDARSMRGQIEGKGLAMSRALAARATNMVLTNQRYALYELAAEIQQSDGDVRYVYVTDPAGQPLVHTFGSGFPRDLLALPAPSPAAPQTVRRLSTEHGMVQDIAVPILSGRGGFAHVGISESRVQSDVRKDVQASLLIIAGMVLLGGAGAFGLATVLTRPVGRLVRATEAVGRGEFEAAAPVWATDEIGRLGIAFNKMTEQLRESAETLVERNRDLEALNAVASAANRSLDAAAVLEAALDEALGVAGATAGWVLVLDGETGELHAAAQRGLDPGADLGAFARRSSGCACLREVLAENADEVRTGCPASAELLPADSDASDIVCVPLRSKGRPVGVLNLLYTQRREPNDRQRQLLLAIGDQVGVALENAHLLAELREKEVVRGQLLEQVIGAQEDERKRIARELHDETGQALTSVAVMLKSLDSSRLSDDVRARVADIQAVAASAVRAVHDLAFELRPSVLDDAGLAPAIERYGREFAERHQIAVDVQVTGIHDRLPAPIETALYRITQEALTNIARHAQATHASLLLERRNGSVLLLVEDDGRGFARQPHVSGAREHLGIHGMEERATLVGGKLTIETEEGAGTSVYVEVPVPDDSSIR